jgi:hypothetical protein
VIRGTTDPGRKPSRAAPHALRHQTLENGRAIFFVVEAGRSRLAELAQRLRDGRLTSNLGAVRPLAEAPAALGPNAPPVSGKTIIRVAEGW